MQLFGTVTYDNNNHLRRFFAKHARYKKEIELDIEERLPSLLNSNSYKIKYAHKLMHNGIRIQEYKIVLTSTISCRVAFIHQENDIKVIYISDQITKQPYCEKLAKTELVDWTVVL